MSKRRQPKPRKFKDPDKLLAFLAKRQWQSYEVLLSAFHGTLNTHTMSSKYAGNRLLF